MFFERAKVGLNEWWRYFAGSVAVFLGAQTIAAIPVGALFLYIGLKGGTISMNMSEVSKSAESVGLGKNTVLAAMLFSFVLACIILFFVVKYLHRKPFLSVVTSRKSFSWKHAGFGFFSWLVLGLVTFYIGLQQTSPDEYTFSFDAVKFLPLLIICILLLPFQTSFEELLFRGYGMQGVGLVTGSRFLALLIPAILFGLMHGANPEVLKHGFWSMMPFYIGMGVFLGVMAIMDDGIEMPMGVHFANNFMAAVFVNMEESALQTDALFIMKNYDPNEGVLYSVLQMLVFLIFAAVVFRWKDWGKLIRRIQ